MRDSGGRTPARSWWIALTLIPLGLGTWAAFLYAGLRRHERRWLVTSAVYGGILAAAWGYVSQHHGERGGLHLIASLILVAVWVGGFAHAMAIRSQVNEPDDAAVESARARLRLRRAGRQMASSDPALARELGVGRPDIAGSDDRGLVDLNNASSAAIAGLPGIDRPLAEAIVAARARVDGFSSVEDLGAFMDLPARTVELLGRRGICLPR